MATTAGSGVSVDAARSWQSLVDRIAAEPDPAVRANLEAVAHHVVAEVAGDLPVLMATLVDEPVYRFTGVIGQFDIVGRDAVEAMYEHSIGVGDNRLEFAIACVVADSETVVTEGIFRQAFSGARLVQLVAESDVEREAWYLVEMEALIVWPIGENRLIRGERVFFGEQPRILKRLEDGELPHLGPVGRTAEQALAQAQAAQ
jgi:hypothetical protein